jgi:hypothetical protein
MPPTHEELDRMGIPPVNEKFELRLSESVEGVAEAHTRARREAHLELQQAAIAKGPCREDDQGFCFTHGYEPPCPWASSTGAED